MDHPRMRTKTKERNEKKRRKIVIDVCKILKIAAPLCRGFGGGGGKPSYFPSSLPRQIIEDDGRNLFYQIGMDESKLVRNNLG